MSESTDSTSSRPDDSGYNNPSRLPQRVRTVSVNESDAFNSTHDTVEEPDPELQSSSGSLPLAVRILARTRRIIRISLLFIVLFAAVLGLYVYAAVLQFWAQVSHYHVLLQMPVWLLLGIVVALIFYALIRLAAVWMQLSKSPQTALEQATLVDAELARAALTQYLEGLIQFSQSQEHQWKSQWKESPESAEVLLKDCRKLMSVRHITTEAWLEEFQDNISRPLDEAAKKRVRFYWKSVGIKTAISPFPLIDAAAVLYSNFLMIGDLAILYGRRLPRHEVFVLLWAIMFQVFVAAHAQEVLDSASEDIAASIESSTARGVVGFFAPKVAEGVVHALITNRIGNRALRILKPVVSRKTVKK